MCVCVFVCMYSCMYAERWKIENGAAGTLVHINIVPAKPTSTDLRSVMEVSVSVCECVSVCVCVCVLPHTHSHGYACTHARSRTTCKRSSMTQARTTQYSRPTCFKSSKKLSGTSPFEKCLLLLHLQHLRHLMLYCLHRLPHQ